MCFMRYITEKIYASTRAYIPFSLCSAPKLFNILADLLVWILVVQGVSFVLHYLDDFITVGHPESLECKQNPQTIIQNCQLCTTGLRKGGRFPYRAGVSGHPPWHHLYGSSLSLDKLQRIYQENVAWLDKCSATIHQILSLVGKLQDRAKVVRPGRAFVRLMYSVAAKVEVHEKGSR